MPSDERLNSANRIYQDARNVPEHMRAKMRTLDIKIKRDFVRTNRDEGSTGTSGAVSGDSRRVPLAEVAQPTGVASSSAAKESHQDDKTKQSSKPTHVRTRSRTFTLSRGDVPSKKRRADAGPSRHGAAKSIELMMKSPSGKSMATLNGLVSASKSTQRLDTAASPAEFVQYLQRVQAPAAVDVAKLHKLRLLIRNETVAWVDAFLLQGGMGEIAGLLHRIMAVEWRYESFFLTIITRYHRVLPLSYRYLRCTSSLGLLF